MQTHAQSLRALCSCIIKYADPWRGDKSHLSAFHEKQNGDKPVHRPPYLAQVEHLYAKLAAGKLSQEICEKKHNWLVAQVLKEVRADPQHAPPYFEQALLGCWQFEVQAFRSWVAHSGKLDKLNSLLKGAIKIIAKRYRPDSRPA